MNLTFLNILAQSEQGQGSALGSQLLMFAIIAVLIWVVMIRPQRKAAKEQQERVASLKKGNKIVTNAGIHGTIVYVDDNTVNVQIAEGVVIKLEKAAVVHVQKKQNEEAPAQNS